MPVSPRPKSRTLLSLNQSLRPTPSPPLSPRRSRRQGHGRWLRLPEEIQGKLNPIRQLTVREHLPQLPGQIRRRLPWRQLSPKRGPGRPRRAERRLRVPGTARRTMLSQRTQKRLLTHRNLQMNLQQIRKRPPLPLRSRGRRLGSRRRLHHMKRTMLLRSLPGAKEPRRVLKAQALQPELPQRIPGRSPRRSRGHGQRNSLPQL